MKTYYKNKTYKKMGLSIFGLIIAAFGFAIKKGGDQRISNYGGIGITVGAILLIIGILSNLVVQIDAGNLGVKKLFGKIDNEVIESGLHIMNPMTEVIELNTKTQNYTMSGVHDEGDKVGDDAIRVLSADGLEVVIDVTVLYRINPQGAPKLLREVGTDYKNVIVRPIVRTRLRDNAVYYDAVSLYSSKREEFQQRIFTTISKDFAVRGLELESVLIRNILLPTSVKATIESKINAEQDAQKMQFVLQKEKQEAERKRVEAQGISDYQKIIASSLNDKQLQYEMIKANLELAKSNNAKIIFTNGSKNPILISDK
jgi:regulator of protease activity HflC (stomatin/prohibitin superfamily)